MNVNWHELLIPETPLVNLVIRGSVMYLVLLAALRVLVRRHVGSLSLMDLLLMVLIADAAQNAMAAEYKSISEGLVLCFTLIGWNYLFDWLSYRFSAFERFLSPPPMPLVKNGQLQRRNMRQELLTEEEVVSLLREQGISDYRKVQLAYIEPDGGVSVVRCDANAKADAADKGPPKKRSAIP